MKKQFSIKYAIFEYMQMAHLSSQSNSHSESCYLWTLSQQISNAKNVFRFGYRFLVNVV